MTAYVPQDTPTPTRLSASSLNYKDFATEAMSNQLYFGIDLRYYDIENVSSRLTRYLPLPVVCSGIYLLLIASGSSWMKTRPAFKLRVPLVLWNITLSIFSITALVILGSPLIRNLIRDGFVTAVCDSDVLRVPWLSLWSYLFVLSKLVEFGDTAFIVLRKTPLTFLHWYHHITVLWYSWYGLATKNTGGHWFAALNVGVHSVMYTYYALKACGFRIPSYVAKSITILQLTQFAFGLVILLAGVWAFVKEQPCGMNGTHLIAGCIMYGSYFLLFLNFFYRRYLKPKSD